MIDMTGYDSADIFTVWQRENGSTGGVGYASGFSTIFTPDWEHQDGYGGCSV